MLINLDKDKRKIGIGEDFKPTCWTKRKIGIGKI